MTPLAAPYVEARTRLDALTEGLTPEAFNRKPAPDSWSAGECVVHLNTLAKGYLPHLEAAVGEGAPRGEGPFRYGWLARTFVNSVRPGSRALPTSPAMKPPAAADRQSDIDMERALGRFRADIDRFLDVIDRADGLDLAKIKVRSPFLKLLKLPLGAALDALGLHALRHVMQAERAVQATAGQP